MPEPIFKVDGKDGNPHVIHCVHCHHNLDDAEGLCCEYYPGMFEHFFREIADLSNALAAIVPDSLTPEELAFRKHIARRCNEIADLHGGA